MKIRLLFSVALASLLALSCKDTSTNPVEQSHAPVFLESEYLNFAWGYDHSGWIVDTAGNVISYDLSKSGVQWTPNATGYYTGEELREKVHHNDTLRGTISGDTLQWLNALVAASVGGTYSDTTHPMADFGTVAFLGYVFDADSSKYRRGGLQVYGGYRFYNTASPAIELSAWMSRQHGWW